jgi:hypothetical protein
MGADPSVNDTSLISLYTEGPFWRLQGVRYAIGQGVLPGGSFQPAATTVTGPLQIYEDVGAQARAFLVYQAEVSSASEALDSISRGTLDATAQVVVEPELFDRILKHLGDQSAEPIKGTVDHFQLDADQVSLEVNTAQPGVLVMTDAPYPGWRAWLDGQPASVLAVNGWLHRAVLVPAGKHRLEMTYRPPHWRLGLLVSLLSCLLTLALGLGDYRGRYPAGVASYFSRRVA